MRLAFALTLAVDFECFLMDEMLSVGDRRFQRTYRDALFNWRAHGAEILISRDARIIRAFCSKALVLDDVDFAPKIYRAL